MQSAAGTFGEEQHYYLDVREQKAVVIPDEVLRPVEEGNEEELAELPAWEQELLEQARLIADDPDEARFKSIPPLESHEAFEIMEMFIQQVPDDAIREKLTNAITRRRPFRSFKDALYEFPELREAWFKFDNDARLQYAREWLERIGVRPEDISQPSAPGGQAKETPDEGQGQ
jgi:hypothetical protein